MLTLSQIHLHKQGWPENFQLADKEQKIEGKNWCPWTRYLMENELMQSQYISI